MHNSKADLSNIVFGKLPPQAPDLEESVLGALMIDRDAVISAIEILRPESFYDPRHNIIFAAIKQLFDKSKPIDLLTVTEELRKMGKLEEAGGPFYITSLTNRVASAAHIEHHARIVAQKFINRELIRISTEIVHDAYEDTTDIFELLESSTIALDNLSSSELTGNEKPVSEHVILLSKPIKQNERGVPVYDTSLSKYIKNFTAGDLYIIAARPSMGKTAKALQIAQESARQGFNVAIFSLEMLGKWLTARMVVGLTGIPFYRIQNGEFYSGEDEILHDALSEVHDLPIFIDDSSFMTETTLRAKAIRMKRNRDIDLIIVDYLQLLNTSIKNKASIREQEISSISRALKGIAKELNIPVIALSQLSRKLEDRNDKRPHLSDLRESGAIEQDADVVMFLHRPEYYGATELNIEGQTVESKGVTELIISKNRNGAIGSAYNHFDAERMTFSDYKPVEIIASFSKSEKRF